MKIALAQLNYRIGDFESNNERIIAAIKQAAAEGADLIVFAELAIGGYPAKDLLRNAVFTDQCQWAAQQIAAHCHEIDCIIGAPVAAANLPDKRLYNAALHISQGKIAATYGKRILSNEDVQDDHRYFDPYPHTEVFHVKEHKVAVTIGQEGLGNQTNDVHDSSADLLVNLAAQPFSYADLAPRVAALSEQARRMNVPLLHVNHVGGQMDLIFEGGSLALNKAGEIVQQSARFAEDLQYVTWQDGDIVGTAMPLTPRDEIAEIHDALVFGLREYFTKSGFQKAVLGLSGGLDSAVVAALAIEALGPDNVLSVLMPSVYSSDHSLQDALGLVENTGSKHLILPIQEIAAAVEGTLSSAFAGTRPDTTEENIQARSRSLLLMAISNKFGHILLNTSNKSEAAVGYGTLYGDMSGSISVIGDVYKTQAYQLAEYINRDKEIIPLHTISKPPSAELRPDQKDSDSLPPYELLDAVLYQLIELEKSGSEVVQLGFDEALVQRIVRLLNNAEFKRHQAPPTLRVSPKGFGPGRAMPLVAKFPF